MTFWKKGGQTFQFSRVSILQRVVVSELQLQIIYRITINQCWPQTWLFKINSPAPWTMRSLWLDKLATLVVLIISGILSSSKGNDEIKFSTLFCTGIKIIPIIPLWRLNKLKRNKQTACNLRVCASGYTKYSGVQQIIKTTTVKHWHVIKAFAVSELTTAVLDLLVQVFPQKEQKGKSNFKKSNGCIFFELCCCRFIFSRRTFLSLKYNWGMLFPERTFCIVLKSFWKTYTWLTHFVIYNVIQFVYFSLFF